jgi:hypothetical protein
VTDLSLPSLLGSGDEFSHHLIGPRIHEGFVSRSMQSNIISALRINFLGVESVCNLIVTFFCTP